MPEMRRDEPALPAPQDADAEQHVALRTANATEVIIVLDLVVTPVERLSSYCPHAAVRAAHRQN